MSRYCAECGNRVGRNGLTRPTPICGKCLMTPYEIRHRELQGCFSPVAWADAARLVREQEEKDAAVAEQQRFERTSSTVHRSRFCVVKV